jgi:hypothetical protein
MKLTPTARGLFVCERVDVDRHHRNVSLINCYTGLHVGSFPSKPREFAIFAGLTGGFGLVNMRVMVSRLSDNHVVYSGVVPVEFRDRVEEVRFILRVKNVVFPGPGIYAVELLAEREWVAQTTLNVLP